MPIRVKLGEPLWRVVGQRDVVVECDTATSTIADVLLKLCDYPGFQAAYQSHADGIGPEYVLFLNDKPLPASAAAMTSCGEGDTLRIILPIAGGE